MLPAPAEDALFTVHSTVQKVLSFGWPALQSMQDSVSVCAGGLAHHGVGCACLHSVWAPPLPAPGSWAEKYADRRQRPAELMLWRLLFQSHVHTDLPFVCDHHVIPLIYFPFVLFSHQQDFDLLP